MTEYPTAARLREPPAGRLTTEPGKVRRRRDGQLLTAMYYRADESNLAQVQAWLLDAVLVGPCSSGSLGVPGEIGEVAWRPGEFLVEQGAGYAAYTPDDFHARFDIRVSED